MDISGRFRQIRNQLPAQTRLVAVSKFHPASAILEAYEAGQRVFGESKVQEVVGKFDVLPKDIVWHFIGHLQTNKVKYIAPFIDTIESVDSLRLFEEIDRCAGKSGRIIKVLLQIHIAKEETKFGFSYDECRAFLNSEEMKACKNIQICGLMGMATFTGDMTQVRAEYSELACFFKELKGDYFSDNKSFRELSMGMSDDYPVAIEAGSTLVRIGSMLFGEREY